MKNFSLLFAALVALPFTLAAGATRAADVETPTMGWSSWNAFRVNISEGTKSRSSATPCCPTSTALSFQPSSK